jgi:hypothetical protein
MGRTSSHCVLWILHFNVHYFQHLYLLRGTGVGRLFLGVGTGVER